MNKNYRSIIDIGCSHHMTGDTSKFEKIKHYNRSSVKLGNDAPCFMKGKWSIILNEKISCDNAYWVEGFKYNLLSVAQLNNSSYWVEFQNKKENIYDATSECRGQKRGNLFYLYLSKHTCLFSQFEDIWLCHKRLCHMNFDNLVIISKMKRVRWLPRLIKPDKVMWKQCQMRNMEKSSFERKAYCYDNILELVHTNLCDPVGVLEVTMVINTLFYFLMISLKWWLWCFLKIIWYISNI